MKISDIGFQKDECISLYGTLSEEEDTAQWQEILPGDDINKTINIIKAVSSEDNAQLILRVIMC